MRIKDVDTTICYGGICLRGTWTGLGAICCFIGIGIGVFVVDEGGDDGAGGLGGTCVSFCSC